MKVPWSIMADDYAEQHNMQFGFRRDAFEWAWERGFRAGQANPHRPRPSQEEADQAEHPADRQTDRDEEKP